MTYNTKPGVYTETIIMESSNLLDQWVAFNAVCCNEPLRSLVLLHFSWPVRLCEVFLQIDNEWVGFGSSQRH